MSVSILFPFLFLSTVWPLVNQRMYQSGRARPRCSNKQGLFLDGAAVGSLSSSCSMWLMAEGFAVLLSTL